MQFIDFKKEHFTRPASSNKFLLDIPRDEIGFAEIDIKQAVDEDHYEEIDYEIFDDIDKVVIKIGRSLNEPASTNASLILLPSSRA